MGAVELSETLVADTCFEISKSESERWHRAANDAQDQVRAMQNDIGRVTRIHSEDPSSTLSEVCLPDGSGPRSGMTRHELHVSHGVAPAAAAGWSSVLVVCVLPGVGQSYDQ